MPNFYGFDFWKTSWFNDEGQVGVVYYWTSFDGAGMSEPQCMFIWDGTFHD